MEKCGGKNWSNTLCTIVLTGYIFSRQHFIDHKSLTNWSMFLLKVILNNGNQIFWSLFRSFGKFCFFFVKQQLEALANFWAQLILGHQINCFEKHRVLVVGTNFRFCQVPDSTIEKQWHFTILMSPFRIEE